MKVMLFAAGRGERLRPLTDHTPKPLLEVAGAPLLVHQLRALAAAGHRDVVINLHHLGAQIEALVGDGRDYGVAVSYSREQQLLDTGGGIVQALPLLGDAPFAVLNGDIVTDFPFDRLPTTLPAGTDLHLVVTPTPAWRERGDFGWRDGRLARDGDELVYCGIAVARPELFRDRPAAPWSLRELLFEAIDGGRVSVDRWTGYWLDIGTPGQLARAKADWQPAPR